MYRKEAQYLRQRCFLIVIFCAICKFSNDQIWALYIHEPDRCLQYIPKNIYTPNTCACSLFRVVCFAIDNCVRSIFFSFYSTFNSIITNRGLVYAICGNLCVTICMMKCTSIAIFYHTCHSLWSKNVYFQLKYIFVLSTRGAIATKQHNYSKLPTLFNISRHLEGLKCLNKCNPKSYFTKGISKRSYFWMIVKYLKPWVSIGYESSTLTLIIYIYFDKWLLIGFIY